MGRPNISTFIAVQSQTAASRLPIPASKLQHGVVGAFSRLTSASTQLPRNETRLTGLDCLSTHLQDE
ncbi:hypothetical protein ES332_A10G227600v1 [Gossypium tomentosum]|uniref:Uncharacterized protein n=1 Tax=Gossypium tomentosum TaxID=34277 RepID=A0A5D2NTI2_GOSTO|nr:hypothetical protein ES332_A10G227600v1 [Gossypium tomentosum]